MRHTTFTEDDAAVWLKGNLHCHSVGSDGNLSVEQLCDAYFKQGFQYLSITDHNIFTPVADQGLPQFTVLNGVEISGRSATEMPIHINAFWAGTGVNIQAGERFALRNYQETAALLRQLRDQGCVLVLNHPHWSMLECSDIQGMPGFHGIEIYNYSTEWLENMGESSIFWESMLRQGIPLWGMAGDDNHNCVPLHSRYCDSFGGFTMVKARQNTAESILEALKSGSFYCSAGPEIHEFFVEADMVHLRCSPVSRIWINGDAHQYQRLLGDGITEFTAKCEGSERYIRAECMDSSGRSAYSNPIFL